MPTLTLRKIKIIKPQLKSQPTKPTGRATVSSSKMKLDEEDLAVLIYKTSKWLKQGPPLQPPRRRRRRRGSNLLLLHLPIAIQPQLERHPSQLIILYLQEGKESHQKRQSTN
jgi:hypothetical protein